ncbi:MAG TPA: polymorphic toxin-type HINT domain-containing protein, partial [Planctomycetaceae bacterium]|nr:polymorphic toxin-type HINT domain-containing protein [Planctomycetaceae bacterium]
TPITTEFQRVTWGRHQGILCVYLSERDFEIEVRQLLVWAPNSYRRAAGAVSSRAPSISSRRKGILIDAAQLAVHDALVMHLLRLRTEKAERLSLIRNDEAEQLNERLTEALRTMTAQKLADSPKLWWDWWQDYSGLSAVPSNAKPVVVVVKEDNQVNVPPPPPRIRMSCLVAGTPILTERGLVAVERIQTGDRVLSKNIETGELAYKVVLHTTVREPFPVTKFVGGDETIQATEGHHFWVAGRGWTKTRELAAEQPLHTPTGVTRVASTERAEPAPTYNLVVADFHTYFVGKSAILSHDVLPPKPTNKVVPGLSDD